MNWELCEKYIDGGSMDIYKDIYEQKYSACNFLPPLFNTQKYLFHYTTLETALEKIFPSRKLRLGLLSSTNDPRETINWRFYFNSNSEVKVSDEEYYQIHKAINEGIRKEIKLLCLSMDGDQSSQYERGYSRPRMWAQYAGNHRGVCLALDKEELIKAAKRQLKKGKLYFGEVAYDYLDDNRKGFTINYDEYLKNGIEKTLDDLIAENNKTYFFTKHQDWKQEAEFRIAFHNGSNEPEYISIEEALQAIIIGMDCPRIYWSLIDRICTSLKVECTQIDWVNGRGELKGSQNFRIEKLLGV